MIFLSVLIASLPVLIFCAFIYYKDKYEKEPKLLLFKCLTWGMFSTIPAFIFEFLGSFWNHDQGTGTILFYSFFVISIVEELVKFIFLRFYIFKNKEFNEPMDGIVYAVFVSMGFALVENICYAIQFGFNNTLIRAFTAVPAHAAFGVMMGYFLGLAKFKTDKKKQLLIFSFISAWFLHGFYDFLILSYDNTYLAAYAIPLIIISLVYAYKMIEENNDLSPFKK